MYESYTISVIIPAYNAESFLRRSLDSALSQTCKPFEIIVIDDGSTDGTAEISGSYGDAIRYIYQDNAGGSSARNTGIKAAKGKWVAFLDVDDEWLPHHLENAVKIFSKHSDLKWYGASFKQYLHESGELLKKFKEKKTNLLIDNAYFKDFMLALPPYAHYYTSTMVIHKSVFDVVGVFDTGQSYGHDIDLWYRIGLHFSKFGYSNEVAAHKYERKSSITYTKKIYYKDLLEKYRKREIMAENMGKEVRRRVEPWIIYWILILIKKSMYISDLQAIKHILTIFKHRLSSHWRFLIYIYLFAPWSMRLYFTLRYKIYRNTKAVKDLRNQ